MVGSRILMCYISQYPFKAGGRYGEKVGGQMSHLPPHPLPMPIPSIHIPPVPYVAYKRIGTGTVPIEKRQSCDRFTCHRYAADYSRIWAPTSLSPICTDIPCKPSGIHRNIIQRGD